MKSIGSIFGVLMITLAIFSAMIIVGEESVSNTNLDSESVLLIANISNNVDNNFNVDSSFVEVRSNLTTNSTFDNSDVFAQEYLEGKSDSTGKTGLIKNAVKVPDLIILSLGVPEQDVLWIKAIIILVITALLSFAAYRAFFGGSKITDN